MGNEIYCVQKKKNQQMMRMLNMQLQMEIKSYNTFFHNQAMKISEVFEDYVQFQNARTHQQSTYVHIGSIDEILIMSEVFSSKNLLTEQESKDLSLFGTVLQRMMGRAAYVFIDRDIDLISTNLERSIQKQEINKHILQNLKGLKDLYSKTFTQENLKQKVLKVDVKHFYDMDNYVNQIAEFIRQLN